MAVCVFFLCFKASLVLKKQEDVDILLSVSPLDDRLNEPHLSRWMLFVSEVGWGARQKSTKNQLKSKKQNIARAVTSSDETRRVYQSVYSVDLLATKTGLCAVQESQ